MKLQKKCWTNKYKGTHEYDERRRVEADLTAKEAGDGDGSMSAGIDVAANHEVEGEYRGWEVVGENRRRELGIDGQI